MVPAWAITNDSGISMLWRSDSWAVWKFTVYLTVRDKQMRMSKVSCTCHTHGYGTTYRQRSGGDALRSNIIDDYLRRFVRLGCGALWLLLKWAGYKHSYSLTHTGCCFFICYSKWITVIPSQPESPTIPAFSQPNVIRKFRRDHSLIGTSKCRCGKEMLPKN